MPMKLRNKIAAGVLSMILAAAAQAEAASPAVDAGTGDNAGNPAIEAKALEIFKRMADYLAAAQEFSYHSESSYDVVQPSGIKVEFGGSRDVLVARPNRLRTDAERRDGQRGVLVFDGETIWATDPDENVYARAAQPGDLNDSLDFAVVELRIKAPHADLLVPDLYEQTTANLTMALDLGEQVLDGVVCDHLLMSNDYTDFQLWITTGDQPVPKRIVITYRQEPGEQQYRAQFRDWNMAPADVHARLDFKPPDGAEQIRFYVPAPTPAQADES
jgi:hypothetical protein